MEKPWRTTISWSLVGMFRVHFCPVCEVVKIVCEVVRNVRENIPRCCNDLLYAKVFPPLLHSEHFLSNFQFKDCFNVNNALF